MQPAPHTVKAAQFILYLAGTDHLVSLKDIKAVGLLAPALIAECLLKESGFVSIELKMVVKSKLLADRFSIKNCIPRNEALSSWLFKLWTG
jgi:hypothetical protein